MVIPEVNWFAVLRILNLMLFLVLVLDSTLNKISETYHILLLEFYLYSVFFLLLK